MGKTLQREIPRRLLALALPFLAAACANDAPNECKMAHVTDLALLHNRGPYLTQAFLNDQLTTMLLDTGSFATILSRQVANRLHLSLQSTGGSVHGIGGHQDLYFFTADNFRIGELHGKRLVLGASAIGTDPAHDAGFDGLFGSDFLSAYDVDFDLPEQKIRLFKIVSGCSNPAAELDEPLYQAPLTSADSRFDRRPHVMVRINGIRLNAIVDSGAHKTGIFRNAARRLGLRLEDLKTDRHLRASGIGPEAREEVEHIMTPITIGEITISNLPVGIIDQRSEGDGDMLLGRDFFSRVHVWISFHSNTMLMQYPPKASPVLREP